MHVTVEPAALLLAAIAVLQAITGWRRGRHDRKVDDVRATVDGWERLVNILTQQGAELRRQVVELQGAIDTQHGELLRLRSVQAELADELARAEREIDHLTTLAHRDKDT